MGQVRPGGGVRWVLVAADQVQDRRWLRESTEVTVKQTVAMFYAQVLMVW